MPLDPAGRVLRSRIGAFSLHAKHSIADTTSAGLTAANDRFLKQVDPDGTLPEGERMRRAAAARQAHMVKLAYLSRQARLKTSGEVE
jgi:hypothetical protein